MRDTCSNNNVWMTWIGLAFLDDYGPKTIMVGYEPHIKLKTR